MMFASAGTALRLHMWSGNQLEPISLYKPKKSYNLGPKITHVSWCHDNSYIALLQEDSHPQILSSKDRTNLSLVHTIQALKHVSAITFKKQTKRIIALANREGKVVLYDTKNRNISKTICSLLAAVKNMEFNSRDDQLAIVCDNSLNIFIDRDGVNNFVKEICLPVTCSEIKFHPIHPNIVGVGSVTGGLTLRDTEKHETVANFQKHSSSVTGVAFTGNQKAIVTTGMDNKICVYDYTISECLFRMNVHQAVTAVDISSDEKYIAAGLEDGCIYIYDIRDPLKPLICTNAHTCPINKIIFENGPVLLDENPFEKNASSTTLNESNLSENRLDMLNSMGDINKMENSEEKLKKDLIKMVKSQMNYLEDQLAEHCSKFQFFVNSEFDSIQNAMARWDVFNFGDTSEVLQAIDTAETKSMKSTSSHKSTHSHLY